MNQKPASPNSRYAAPDLLEFGQSLLSSAGLAPDRARDVADVLLEGDLLGHSTHGFALLPAYLTALDENAMAKSGDPSTIADHGSAFTWDGHFLPGPWLLRQAIQSARQRLHEHPVITAAIARSHHIGCLAAYLKPVTDSGLMIVVTCSDPACRSVTPHGGLEPRFSPNPIAAGIPTNAGPILIDISTSTTANGQCRRAAEAGERLPGQWLIDSSGKPTDDPRVMTNGEGSLLPLGGLELGHKGFALALLVEALTNALAGHGRADIESKWEASVFLQIIDPARFGGRDSFLRETSFLADSCRSTPVAPGKAPVRMPGDAALVRRTKQLADGVELQPTILTGLTSWAKRFHVLLPKSE